MHELAEEKVLNIEALIIDDDRDKLCARSSSTQLVELAKLVTDSGRGRERVRAR